MNEPLSQIDQEKVNVIVGKWANGILKTKPSLPISPDSDKFSDEEMELLGDVLPHELGKTRPGIFTRLKKALQLLLYKFKRRKQLSKEGRIVASYTSISSGFFRNLLGTFAISRNARYREMRRAKVRAKRNYNPPKDNRYSSDDVRYHDPGSRIQ